MIKTKIITFLGKYPRETIYSHSDRTYKGQPYPDLGLKTATARQSGVCPLSSLAWQQPQKICRCVTPKYVILVLYLKGNILWLQIRNT